MKKNLYYILFIGILMTFLAGCQDEGLFTSADDEPVNVSYRVKVEDGLQSRAIGDVPQVNNLSVLVFDEKGNLVLPQRDLAWSEVQSNGLSLPLFKGTYQVLFWLQYADDNLKPYTIANDGQVTVSYDRWTGNISDVEKWDAFYLVDTLKINNSVQDKSITLTRPVGQLNWAAQDGFDTSEHQVVVTLSNVATTFHPFNKGANTQDLAENEITFTFNGFTTETLNTDEGAYTYLTCNYLFPATLTATFDLQKNDGTSVKNTGQLDNIVVEKNKRTNVLGSIVQEPEAPAGWNGVKLTQPEQAEGHYIIDEPSDLAWLASDDNNLTEAATFLVTENLDMASKEIASVKLPGGSTFDGGSKTIKNFANSLFGNATNLTVQNLFLDNVQATSDGHVGVLVNTLTGSSSFTGVTIANSSATTDNGAAGGMVGYIVRSSEKERDENLTVTFSNCDLMGVAADGTQSEGKFVGLLSGYDNGETLSFDAQCSADENTSVTDYASYYKNENQSIWLNAVNTKYDGWLGTETYRRGNITFDGVRLVPKWDGTTMVEPIYEDTNKKIAHIWSPFDLAYLGGKSLTTLRFKADVDMAGVCDDCKDGNGNSTQANDDLSSCEKCKAFSPIIQLNNLYGENHTLYNLFVQGEHEADGSYNDGMGFIRHTNSGTFEHFTFDGAIIKCIDDFDYRNDDQKGGNGYAGTLTSRVAAKMTINNVHARNGHVIGISKFGGLIGYVPGGIEATGCSVDNYVIENHRINVNNSYSVSIEKEFSGLKLKAECSEDFYTEGEAGGFIGFISSDATITNCQTSNITMKCYGQTDRDTKIKTYSWGKKYVIWGDYQWNATRIDINYTIAGRHVNTFIGDIRTPSSNTVVINECSTSGNCADGYDYNITKIGKGELVGCCYFVGKDIEILGKSMHAGDYKGTVTIDGEEMPFVGG